VLRERVDHRTYIPDRYIAAGRCDALLRVFHYLGVRLTASCRWLSGLFVEIRMQVAKCRRMGGAELNVRSRGHLCVFLRASWTALRRQTYSVTMTVATETADEFYEALYFFTLDQRTKNLMMMMIMVIWEVSGATGLSSNRTFLDPEGGSQKPL